LSNRPGFESIFSTITVIREETVIGKRGSEKKTESLERWERVWSEHADPDYYATKPPRCRSTLDASIEALIGRGRSGQVMAAPAYE